MDNRWRFLYSVWTELWGRGQKASAGNGKPGTSEVAVLQVNPQHKANA